MSLKTRLKTPKRQFAPRKREVNPETAWGMLTTLAEKEVKTWLSWAEKTLKNTISQAQARLTTLTKTYEGELGNLKSRTEKDIKEHIRTRSVEIKGKDGKDGRDGTDGENGIDGIDGVDGKDGKDGKNGKDGKDGSPDTPEQVKGKLIELPIKERWFDWRHLKNIPVDMGGEKRTIHRGGGSAVFSSDLSASTDGATKTFTVPAHTRALLLIGSDFPIIYRPTVDFTTSGTTLTLTDAVPAPTDGATLTFLYVQ